MELCENTPSRGEGVWRECLLAGFLRELCSLVISHRQLPCDAVQLAPLCGSLRHNARSSVQGGFPANRERKPPPRGWNPHPENRKWLFSPLLFSPPVGLTEGALCAGAWAGESGPGAAQRCLMLRRLSSSAAAAGGLGLPQAHSRQALQRRTVPSHVGRGPAGRAASPSSVLFSSWWTTCSCTTGSWPWWATWWGASCPRASPRCPTTPSSSPRTWTSTTRRNTPPSGGRAARSPGSPAENRADGGA